MAGSGALPAILLPRQPVGNILPVSMNRLEHTEQKALRHPCRAFCVGLRQSGKPCCTFSLQAASAVCRKWGIANMAIRLIP